jgi:hypothetical protein
MNGAATTLVTTIATPECVRSLPQLEGVAGWLIASTGQVITTAAELQEHIRVLHITQPLGAAVNVILIAEFVAPASSLLIGAPVIAEACKADAVQIDSLYEAAVVTHLAVDKATYEVQTSTVQATVTQGTSLTLTLSLVLALIATIALVAAGAKEIKEKK